MFHPESDRERRRYVRHPGTFDAWCGDDNERIAVRVMNLGLGGCLIDVSSEHMVGETFRLQVDLGAAGLLDVSATTLYHTSHGSAVTFLNLSQDAFNQIRRTVAALWASTPT